MKKKFLLHFLLLAFGLIISTKAATDPAVGAQNLTYSIPAVSVFSLSGDVAFGTFTVPAAGSDFSGIAANSSLYYNVTNNAGSNSRKITVQMGSAYPAGIGLAMIVAPPSGSSATYNGIFSPTNASATVTVQGLGNGAWPNNRIYMTLTSAVGTAAVGSGTLTATFTLISQ